VETWNSLCAKHGDVNCQQNVQEALVPGGIMQGIDSQHKRQSRTNRDKSGYLEAVAADFVKAGQCRHRRRKSKEPILRASGQARRPSFVRANPFVPEGEPALRFANALRVNAARIHEKPGGACISGLCNDNCRG